MNIPVSLRSSDQITRAYMDSLLVEVRHLDAVLADTTLELYGKKFETPVATAALSHLGSNTCPDGMKLMAQGAFEAGAPVFSGMGSMEELESMTGTGASVIKIIKPYKDRQSVYDKIAHAEKNGCLAVGIDIDHAFSRNGYDCIEGMEMRPMTTEELADMVKSTNLPFVIKGVLSMQDAEKCLKAGVKGMLVSHHNGRVDCSMPPLMILPKIRELVGKDYALFVDCSLQSGLDVFKALSLGATACCIGRPLMPCLKEEGAEGVRKYIRNVTEDLRYTMGMTCISDLKHMDPTVVHQGFSY